MSLYVLLVSSNPGSYDAAPVTVSDATGLPVRESFAGSQAITPSDSTVYNPPLLSLWVGTGGTVVITNLAGHDQTFANVPNGTRLPTACTKVKAATTASGIIGLN